MLVELPLSTNTSLTRQFAVSIEMTMASWCGCEGRRASLLEKLISAASTSLLFSNEVLKLIQCLLADELVNNSQNRGSLYWFRCFFGNIVRISPILSSSFGQ